MKIKHLLHTIAVSMIIMIFLMIFIYDFDISLINLSNVIFLMGVFLFFPGLIIATGASEVFDSCGYLTRKIFTKNGEGDFKTLSDYKEYRKLKSANGNIAGIGLTLFILGGAYIIISLMISFIH